MLPAWQKLYAKPKLNYPGGYVLGAPLPAATQTVEQWLNSATGPLVPYATLIATEGVAAAEQRKWRANLVANYTFSRETFLRGWNLGTGVRWQDKIGIGYRAERSPAGIVKLDIANPYYSPAETNVDAFLGYKRKLWKDRVEWKVQLNVRNLIGQSDPIAITVQPTGEAATVRLPPERRWYVTNTFSF
jgi:outer membrane receptor protein involved in Fe transport